MVVEKLIDAWLDIQRNWWAYTDMDDLVRDKPEEALAIIEKMAHHAEADIELLGSIAAGPLEDLLAFHGEKIILDIEAAAKREPLIKRCLAGVWQNAMSDEIWNRVKNAAEPGFKFP